jgi:hypothetical protein
MSLEDLKNAGLILPEEEWGQRRLKARLKKKSLLLVGIGLLFSIVFIRGEEKLGPGWVLFPF